MVRKTTCCIAGHRRLPPEQIAGIALRLDEELERLLSAGILHFLAGATPGFDQMAGELLLSKRAAGANIHLTLVLPHEGQERFWPLPARERYQHLLREADRTTYISHSLTPNCVQRRNQYIVDHSAYCLCALLSDDSNTARTVEYAKSQGLSVRNVAISSGSE